MILALVGFPPGFAADFRKQVDESMHYDQSKDPEAVAAEAQEARRGRPQNGVLTLDSGVFSMLPDVIKQRRSDPKEDLLSSMVHTDLEDGKGGSRKLTDNEIAGFVQLLSSAGSETVVRLLGFSAVELTRNPDQRQALVDDPDLISNAVEETLRYEPPSPIQGRWVAGDIEFHGTVVPRGSKMALLNASANRDERHFPDPDRFDVRRQIDRHLSLGYGTHFCIGGALARLEGRVALAETLKRFPRLTVDEDGLERIHTTTVRGYTHVSVTPG